MNEKKYREHKFVDKAPIISAILLAIIGFFVLNFSITFINELFTKIIPLQLSAELNLVIQSIEIVLFAFIGLLLYKKWFTPDFAGQIKYGQCRKATVLLVAYAVFFLYDLIVICLNTSLKMLNMTALITVLSASIIGECVFSGFAVTTLMRNNKKENILVPILVPAVVRAFVSLANIFVGVDPVFAVMQVLATFIMGVVLSGIYILSGNILLPIGLHIIHNIVAMSSGAYKDNGVFVGTYHWSDIIGIIPIGILCVFCLYYLTREKNKQAIIEIWNQKWSKTEIT